MRSVFDVMISGEPYLALMPLHANSEFTLYLQSSLVNMFVVWFLYLPIMVRLLVILQFSYIVALITFEL